MSRILVNDQWYDELSLTSIYEIELERIVMDQATHLFPEWHVVPFKTRVSSEHDTAEPDLALIDKQYLVWWVVEIEMSHHSFGRHVLPQVRTLSQACYGGPEVAFLHGQDMSLDCQRLLDMMKGRQPQVLVIVNMEMPSWVQPLAKFDASVAVFEVFRSANNRHIFRVSGEYPARSVDVVSRCSFDPLVHHLLVIDSPAGMGVAPGGRVEILYENRVTEWQRVDAQDKVWLSPIRCNPLPPRRKFELVRRSDGCLVMRVRSS